MKSHHVLLTVGVLALLLATCTSATAPTPSPSPASQPTVAPQATARLTPTVVSSAKPPGVSPSPTPGPALTPAKDQPRRGGILRIAKGREPNDWEPDYTPGSGWNRDVQSMVFSVLAENVVQDKPCELRVRPAIAESWRWPDDTTFEIKVRQGVRFQNKAPVNGRQLTAEDVAYSINRAFTVRKRGVEGLADFFKGVKVMDRATVRILTDRPLPSIVESYMASLYQSTVLAREAGGPKERWDGPDSYIGSGPFSLEKYLPGVKLTYARHKDYWRQDLPYVDVVEHLLVLDVSTQVAVLRAGKADILYGQIPPSVALGVGKGSPQFAVQKCLMGTGFSTTILFMRTDQPPFNDARVRRAVSMAIDRQALVDVLLGEAIPTTTFPPPLSSLYLPSDALSADQKKLVSFDAQDARRLLAEAGFPNGLDVVFSTTNRYASPYPEMAQALADMLGKAGFRPKLVWIPGGQWQQTAARGNYEGILFSLIPYNQPMDVLTRFHSRRDFEANRGHVSDPELDALIEKFQVATAEEGQKDLAYKIQKRLIDQTWAVFTVAPYEYALSVPKVKGLMWGGDFNVVGPYVERIWLAE